MPSASIEFRGLKELKAAITRNPEQVKSEARDFLARGLAAYKRGINNDPWRVGGGSGGSPVSNDPRYPRRWQRQRSGNLRDTHTTEISGLEGRIGPNLGVAPYGVYVHEGTRRMKKRPWLDYVKKIKEGEIEKLFTSMLNNIVHDLAK
jgi:hypothetical protein